MIEVGFKTTIVKSNDELELLEKKLKKRDIGRPDHGLAGTRDICAEIGTFPQKAGQVVTLKIPAFKQLGEFNMQ